MTAPGARVLLLGLALSASGCVVTIPGEGRASRHVILGFGVVSVNRSCDDRVVATDSTSLGVSVTDRPALKFALGYASSTVITVAPDVEDVRVELAKPFGGPLIVDTRRAKAKPRTAEGGASDCD